MEMKKDNKEEKAQKQRNSFFYRRSVKLTAFLMMLVLAGVAGFCLIRVINAVDIGGPQILTDEIQESYYDSATCAQNISGWFAYILEQDIRKELAEKQYKQTSRNTAFSECGFFTWLSESGSLDERGWNDVGELANILTAERAEKFSYSQSELFGELKKKWGYPSEDYLEAYAAIDKNNFVKEDGSKKSNQYIVVDADFLKSLLAYYGTNVREQAADKDVTTEELWDWDNKYYQKYVVNNGTEEAEEELEEIVTETDIDGDISAIFHIRSGKEIRIVDIQKDGIYMLRLGDMTWRYTVAEDTIECSRFGRLNLKKSYYYNVSDFAEAIKKDVNIMSVFFTAPLFYREALVNYYGYGYYNKMQAQKNYETAISGDRNWNYVVTLKDGQKLTSYPEGKTYAVSAIRWTYDYSTGIESNHNGQNRYLLGQVESMLAQREPITTEDATESVLDYLTENKATVTLIIDDKLPFRDGLREEKEYYEKNVPYLLSVKIHLMVFIITGCLALLLFLYLLVTVGLTNTKGERQPPLPTFSLPTEFILLFPVAAGMVGVVFADVGIGNLYRKDITLALNVISAVSIAAGVVILAALFELLDRLRHRMVLKKSLCLRLLKLLFRKPFHWLLRISKKLWERTKRDFKVFFANIREMKDNFVYSIRLDKRITLLFLEGQIFLILSATFFGAFLYDGEPAFVFWLFLTVVFFLITVNAVWRDMKNTAIIMDAVKEIQDGNLDYQIDTEHMKGHKKELALHINALQGGLKLAVEQSLKDERLKTELITNVSHDIKTPLTSIINYVDLLKKENIEGENVTHYLEVLDQKSQRLKQLMEDLVEVSKSATGNVEFVPVRMDLTELLRQTFGEFEVKFASRHLTVVEDFKAEKAVVMLDSRHTYRIFENLCQNIYKYAMEHSRVYVDLQVEEGKVVVVIKNISQYPLNISADELMERFVRGDASRNTSGSGLGLTIAKNLVTLQHGTFEIVLDGDLFKVIVTFPENAEM